MRQVKPKHRLMMTLFEDLRWILFVLYIRRIHPICQTGNTDRSEALGWGFPMRGPGLLEFFGWGNEEVYESAAQGRNRPPPVADEIEVTGHGKPLDFQASEHSCFQLRVYGPGGEDRHSGA